MRYRPKTKLLCSFLLLLLPLAAVAEAYADLVFRNGAVYTVDAERSWAQAVAVTDGRMTFMPLPRLAGVINAWHLLLGANTP